MITRTWAWTDATSSAVRSATSSGTPRRRLMPPPFFLAHVPLQLVQFAFHAAQQRREPFLVVAEGGEDLVVVDGQERVDEGLLVFLLVVAADDLGPEGDLAQEGEGEEHTDDPAVDDQRADRVERRVGGQDEGDPEG